MCCTTSTPRGLAPPAAVSITSYGLDSRAEVCDTLTLLRDERLVVSSGELPGAFLLPLYAELCTTFGCSVKRYSSPWHNSTAAASQLMCSDTKPYGEASCQPITLPPYWEGNKEGGFPRFLFPSFPPQ